MKKVKVLALCAAALLLVLAAIVAQAQEPAGRPYAEGNGALATGRVEGGPSQETRAPEGWAGSSGRGRLEAPGGERLPAVDGLSVLYRFSGAADDGEQGSANAKRATSVHCSNVGASDAQIEVQIVQWNGTDIYTGTINLAANRNATFSTQNTTVYFEDVVLGGLPGTPLINQGSGRILSSHPKVICTAQVLDPVTSPPEFATVLELFTD